MKDILIYCKCNRYQNSLPNFDIQSIFDDNKVSYYQLNDICSLAVTSVNELSSIFEKSTKYVLIACYPRAVENILKYAGVETSIFSILYLNQFENSNEAILKIIGENTFSSNVKCINGDSQWLSWYPVIDYSLCINCGQCADFCLFGVYFKEKNRVRVASPKSCKTNCPACARICPTTAIIFPKYKEGGAIAGEDNFDKKSELLRQNEDIQNILGNDLYSALEQRKKKRQSIVREAELEKALRERDSAQKTSF